MCGESKIDPNKAAISPPQKWLSKRRQTLIFSYLSVQICRWGMGHQRWAI